MPLTRVTFGVCVVCGEKFQTKPSHLNRRKTCSKSCDKERRRSMYKGASNPNYGNRGPKNPLFKTGERITSYGYKMIYKPYHPNSQYDGYIFEHRFVMSEFLGRPLKENEDVHHKDSNKLNNSIDNLELLTRSEHTKIHNKEKEIIRDHLGRIVIVLKKEAE